MTVDEIIQIATRNIDKSVVLHFESGETLVATVLTVDDEGLVYDPDPRETRENNPLYWTSFSEIAEIQPEGAEGSAK